MYTECFYIGIPELGVPACEPLEINSLALNQASGPIHIKSNFKNVKLYGLSDFKIRAVRINVDKAKFRLRLWFPELYMNSDYHVKGKFLMVPLEGRGKAFGNFSDIDAVVSLKSDRILQGDKEFLKVKDIFAEFNIGYASIKLDNLFNNNQELTETLNSFLNENWQSMTSEVKPELEKFISKFLNESTCTLFEKYPYNQLILIE